MKLHEIDRGTRSVGTLSEEEWEEGVHQLDLAKDIANSMSDKTYILEVTNNNNRPQCNVITENDDDGYPSITLSKIQYWDSVVQQVPHYFVFRQTNKAMGVSSVVENLVNAKDAIKIFVRLLKEIK